MNDTDTASKPLRLTLEEALRYIVRHRAGMQQDNPDYDARIEPGLVQGWVGITHQNSGHFTTWTEAFSAVLRVPVVEHDDKAELVEALEGALVGLNRALSSDFDDDIEAWQSAEDAREAVRAALAKWKAKP